MIEHDENISINQKEETFSLLKELHNSSDLSQRELSLRLNVSLGKINYLLKELIKRGLISVQHFSTRPEKIRKMKYMLTTKGFNAWVSLGHYFLKRKEEEYTRIKSELEAIQRMKSNVQE